LLWFVAVLWPPCRGEEEGGEEEDEGQGIIEGKDEGEEPEEGRGQRVGRQKAWADRLKAHGGVGDIAIVVHSCRRRCCCCCRWCCPGTQGRQHKAVPAGVGKRVLALRIPQGPGVQATPRNQVAAYLRPPRARRQVQRAPALLVAALGVEPPAEEKLEAGQVTHHGRPVQARVSLRVGLAQERRRPLRAAALDCGVLQTVQRPDPPVARSVVEGRLPVGRVRRRHVASLLEQVPDGGEVAGPCREEQGRFAVDVAAMDEWRGGGGHCGSGSGLGRRQHAACLLEEEGGHLWRLGQCRMMEGGVALDVSVSCGVVVLGSID
jgi:hypothetical protein